MSQALPEIAALVKREIGVVIKESQFAGLEAVVGRIAPGAEPGDLLAALAEPRSGPALLSDLVDEVTIQETYFFREARELEAIDWNLLLRRAAPGEPVRIWVPACATGEEAYTIAMLATEAFAPAEAPVTILATDVADTAIVSALAGVYSPRSVRNVPAALRERHFGADGARHTLREPLKSMVSFRLHNLVNESSPPLGEAPFDLIACRNVLIYFDNDTVRQVVRSLCSALRPGAELILGAADRLTGTTARLAGSADTVMPIHEPQGAGPARKLRRPLGLPEPELDHPPEPGDPRPPAEAPRELPEGAGGRIEAALWAADAGALDDSLAITQELLEADPLDSDALFVRGLAELAREDSGAAISALRSCLYIDPSFGLAAFELGRAHDAAGDDTAAQTAYRRALRTLGSGHGHRAITDQVEMEDVAAACRLRLGGGWAPAAS